jgi:hypothetical protein
MGEAQALSHYMSRTVLGSRKLQTLHKLKNRIINFRVTDEALDRLKTSSHLHGARCLSDFARTVMLGTTAGSDGDADRGARVEEELQSLECRLLAVESDLTRVIKMLSSAGEICRKS